MADVRSAAGVPTLANFGGLSSPSPGTSLYINLSTGDIYAVLTGDVVTKLSSIITFPITLAQGGTSASLTASNGGIFYSTATAGAILSGTATAGQILRSGSNAAPSWSTATYPSTAGTAGNVLRSDGTNLLSALLSTNDISPGEVVLTEAAPTSLDISTGVIFDLTLTASRTLNFTGGSSALDGKKIILRIKQGGSGSYLITWGTGSHFGTDFTSITLSTAVNAVDVVGIVYRHAATSFDIVAYSRGF